MSGGNKSKMLHLTLEDFVENIPGPCALISSDYEIIAMNGRLKDYCKGDVNRKCYEILAELDEPCAVCQLRSLFKNPTVLNTDHLQARFGISCLVSFGYLQDSEGSGLLLETVRPLTDHEDTCRKALIQSQKTLSDMMEKLSGLISVSRTMMQKSSMESKIDLVISQIEKSMGAGPFLRIWIEINGKLYGRMPDKIEGTVSVQEIRVENVAKGKICANFSFEHSMLPEDEFFLQETADLIGRQIEISELETMLRFSEERYRKLASNLAKEMWSRTEALSQERSYLEGVLMSSADIIITTDLEGRIVEFNPAAESFLGYSSEEVQGRKISDIWVDSAERDRILEEVTLSGGITNYQTQLRHKSGDIVEISLTLSLLKDGEGRVLGTVGISKDVGKEKAIMRELERLNQNYMEAVHFINHEMKNSLIVIGGFVKRLLNTETDSSRRDQLEIIYHHSKFLEAMSRDFLTLADIEHGEFQIRKEHIEDFYEQVILPAMLGLKERYPNSFQSYDASMGGVGMVRVNADPRLLEVVYRNLFGNALKYGKPNGRIAYGVSFGNSHYTFNVWNEGPGVDPDEAEKIFKKFYRVKNENTSEKRGTGLGLYNIRKIIEAHGGKIWCESQPGSWVNFLFTLPR